eukprot:3203066-Rhodomonas_salina.1
MGGNQTERREMRGHWPRLRDSETDRNGQTGDQWRNALPVETKGPVQVPGMPDDARPILEGRVCSGTGKNEGS